MVDTEPFWEHICQYTPYLWLGFMVILFLFVLTIISLLFAPVGSNAFGITLANLVLSVSMGTVLMFMYRKCAKRQRQYY